MEFWRENEIVDSDALQILSERVQIAARVREWYFTELRSDETAALDTNLKTIHVGDDGTEGFVGAIEALQKARMLPVVKSCGTKQQVEGTERADEFPECRIRLGDRRGESSGFRRDFLNWRTDFEARITPRTLDR
jgi:hypothetical protein